MGQALCYIYRV